MSNLDHLMAIALQSIGQSNPPLAEEMTRLAAESEAALDSARHCLDGKNMEEVSKLVAESVSKVQELTTAVASVPDDATAMDMDACLVADLLRHYAIIYKGAAEVSRWGLDGANLYMQTRTLAATQRHGTKSSEDNNPS